MATTDGLSLKLTITDNSPEALRELEAALEVGLTKCGLQAERTAKQRCPVGDPTKWHPPQPKGSYIGGTLRNSITFALDGDKAHEATYKVESGNKAVKGEYKGQAPKEPKNGLRALYVGTNVYYAPYVEMGTSKYPTKREFIRPALAENWEKFRTILIESLRGKSGYIT